MIYTTIFTLYSFWVLCFQEGKNNNYHKQKGRHPEITAYKEQNYLTCNKIWFLFSCFIRKHKHLIYSGNMNTRSDCNGVTLVKCATCICSISMRK